MATARKLIKKAMQKAGILTKNSEPDADEYVDGLDALNAMLGSWINDSLLVYANTRESFTLSANEAYTIGVGGTFNTVRPTNILQAYVSLGDIKYADLEIVSDVTYQRYKTELTLLGTPQCLNFDNAYPLATIRVFPIPSVNYVITILSEKPLSSLTLDSEVSLPSGWERAIVYNLAKEIAGEYGQQLDNLTLGTAAESLSLIKLNVAKNTPMSNRPVGATGSFDIFRGY